MISRFFSNAISRRFLCVLLALFTCFCALSPALVQPAEAVAAVDDAAVITLGLLMVTLAGVTFAQCNQAVSSVRSFLYNRSSAASSLLTLVTKCWVDGGKVLLNGDFRGAFSDILPSIHDYFVTTDGAGKVGNAVGSVFSPSAVFNYDSIDSLPDLSPYLIYQWVDGASYIMSTSGGGYKGTYRGSGSKLRFYSLTSGHVLPPDPYVITTYGNCFGVIVNKGVSYLVYQNRDGKAVVSSLLRWGSSSNPGSFYLSDGDISFSQSGTVDGSLTVGNLDSADLKSNDIYLPVPSYSGVVSSGLAGSTAAPGLSPDVITKAIQDALYVPGSGAEVLPTEVPDVTDATDPSENPDKNPDDPSEGNWLWPGLEIMFTELKENANQIGSAIQEKIDSSLERLGDRVQQLQDGILPQIEAFKDTVTQGFVDCQNWFQGLGDSIASALDALGTKLSTGIQSCFDTLREFATQTFPAKMAEVGQWIQSLPEKIAEAVKKILPEHEDLGTAHPADWKSIFPFCVPFDLIDFLGILAAEPEAPKFTWRFYAPPVVDQEIEIDLSPWDGVAQVVRTMELLAFCVGLILLTRNIIRG